MNAPGDYFGDQAVLKDFSAFAGTTEIYADNVRRHYVSVSRPPKPVCGFCKVEQDGLFHFEGQEVNICGRCIGKLVMWAGRAAGLSNS